MTIVFGRREELAIEIGDFVDGSDKLRIVDVWVANRWLTCDDNVVYVPQFLTDIRYEINRLLESPGNVSGRRPFSNCSFTENQHMLLDIPKDVELDDERRFEYFFMQWGPTADNVSVFLFREDGVANITFQFLRKDHPDPREIGVVFMASAAEDVLEKILIDAANYLESNITAPA